MEQLLVCNNISKTYQDGNVITQILKNVNFSIDHSEFVAIIGASGSGKSSLLHILGALDIPTQGDVFFQGQNLCRAPSNIQAKIRNQSLGFIYQFHHLLADFSALENTAMPLLIGGCNIKNALMQAEKLLARVGLAHRMCHRPSKLSGGERQRVAIARALINKPALVLADEPTGNLDHTMALDIYTLMRELNQEFNTAFLVVTHDQELASKMDRKIQMQNGSMSY